MNAVDKIVETHEAQTAVADCVAFVSDNQTHGVVESAARQFFDEPIVRDGGSQQALEYLSENAAPKVLIVDIGDSSAPLTAMLSLTVAFNEEIRVIGIGTVNDINLYREMVGAGITDYLVKPVTEKALASALARAEEPIHSDAPGDQPAAPKVNRIAVIGARGGVGASTVAVNLAWLMSQERKLRTALVDLDLEFGTIALSLDLEPTRGLREALESPGRIDSLFIESATARVNDKFSVMATEETLSEEISYNPNAIDVLFESLGRTNDCIVVDLPRAAFAVRQRVFEAATNIVLVTELSLSCLRDAMRLVTGIEEVAQDTPITVIANRAVGSHKGVQVRDFQKALGRKIDFTMPEETKALNKAANSGKPLVQINLRAPASKMLNRLSRKLSPGEENKKDKSAGSWRGFLKKG